MFCLSEINYPVIDSLVHERHFTALEYFARLKIVFFLIKSVIINLTEVLKYSCDTVCLVRKFDF